MPRGLLPLGGHIDERRIEVGDGTASEQPHGPNEVGAQNVDRSRDAWLPRGAQTIGIGTADQHRSRPKADRLDDVAAAADAAVHQYFDTPADRGDDFRQDAKRCRNTVKLPAAVIRPDDRVGALIDRPPPIVAGVNPFDNDRPLPRVTNPSQIAPRDDRLLERGADVGVRHRPDAWQYDVRKLHQPAVPEKAHE